MNKPYRPILPPKAGYIERGGRYYDAHTGELLRNDGEFTTDEIKHRKLAENSELCNYILENEFKSAAKGDGLQPYRMNRDDQANLNGLISRINMAFLKGWQEELPLFPWKNANKLKCADDWHYTQVIDLFDDFGNWKTLVLKRQDDIKEQIFNAQTDSQINIVEIDYGDLLVFEGGVGSE